MERSQRGFEVYLRAWNLCVEAGRTGKLTSAFLHNRLRSMPGKAVWWPVVLSALKDYHSLCAAGVKPRYKSESRLKTIPCAGPLKGILPKDALHGRIRKQKRGFTSSYTVKTAPVPFNEAALRRRAYHNRNILDVGMAVTPEGLRVREQALDGRRSDYLIPNALLALPEAPKEILTTTLRGRALSVTLDPSLMGTLSHDMQAAMRRMHRWMRARKAVGAVAYRKLASLGEVSRRAVEALKNSEAASPLVVSAATRHCEDCPTCGVPTLLAIDPNTGLPTLMGGACRNCGTAGDIGAILANRALVLGTLKRGQKYGSL